MDHAAAEAFVMLAIVLFFLPSPISSLSTFTSSISFPSCRCDVNKPLQYVLYMSDDAIKKRLSRWDANVRGINLGKWKNIPTSDLSASSNVCDSHLVFSRSVDYQVPVTPPAFLKPFVENIQAFQHKNQDLLDCISSDRFVMNEDAVISNLPIISSIAVSVSTPIVSGSSPTANVTVTHQDLPWYMQIISPDIHTEILHRTEDLWRITVADLCRCAA